MSKIRVLVVDDSMTIRAMIASIFEADRDIDLVGLADSAEEAEEILRNDLVDVVTLDINMPGMNGLEFLSNLQSWNDKPVIILSGLSSRGSEERLQALHLGAVACFNKANAIKEAPRLIKLIKDAANHKLKPDLEDQQALAAWEALAHVG